MRGLCRLALVEWPVFKVTDGGRWVCCLAVGRRRRNFCIALGMPRRNNAVSSEPKTLKIGAQCYLTPADAAQAGYKVIALERL
jgi:hypothetical protein